MDRCVMVSRCKRTGAFLLNPVNTSRPSGINLWEVSTAAADEALGETVIDLLARSGRTDVASAEDDQPSGESREEETERIWSHYGLDGPTARFARRCLLATVEHRHGRKSWRVQVLCYDPRQRAMSGEGQRSVRVRHSAGAAALGAALRATLDLPRPRRIKRRS